MTWPKGLLVALAAVWLAGCAAGSGQLANPGQSAGQATDLERLAQQMERKGDYGAAAQFYRQAIQGADTPSATQLLDLSQVLYRAGRFEEAEAAYKRARELAPKEPDVHYGLGKTRLALDRPQAALDSFDAALDAGDTRRIRAYLGKGVALDMLGRHGEAQQVYQTALDNAPDDLKLLNNYGLSLVLSGDYAAATDVLSALAEDPTAGEKVRQNLALAHALAGDMQKASKVARYDLSDTAVKDNMVYYRALRDRLDQRRTDGSSRNRRAIPDTGGETAGQTPGSSAAPSRLQTERYWAQLGAFRARRAAQREWRQIVQDHSDLLADLGHKIVEFTSNSDGTFYRLRAGPLDASDRAQKLCRQLREQDQPCAPVGDSWSSS